MATFGCQQTYFHQNRPSSEPFNGCDSRSSRNVTSDSSVPSHSEINAMEYEILMDIKELEPVTITSKLYHAGYLDNDHLYTLAPGSNGQFKVKAPNAYIQKIRSLYFLMIWGSHLAKGHRQRLPSNGSTTSIQKSLDQTSRGERSTTDIMSRWINIFKKRTYEKITKCEGNYQAKVNAKYMAEFFQFLDYHCQKNIHSKDKSHPSNSPIPEQYAIVISELFNKYPIMDEIMIDSMMEYLKPLNPKDEGIATLDDNLTISDGLAQNFSILCIFVSFWEFCIDKWKISIRPDGFDMREWRDPVGEIVEELDKLQRGLDVSNVGDFNNNVFEQLDDSYIGELDSMISSSRVTENGYSVFESIHETEYTHKSIQPQANIPNSAIKSMLKEDRKYLIEATRKAVEETRKEAERILEKDPYKISATNNDKIAEREKDSIQDVTKITNHLYFNRSQKNLDQQSQSNPIKETGYKFEPLPTMAMMKKSAYVKEGQQAQPISTTTIHPPRKYDIGHSLLLAIQKSQSQNNQQTRKSIMISNGSNESKKQPLPLTSLLNRIRNKSNSFIAEDTSRNNNTSIYLDRPISNNHQSSIIKTTQPPNIYPESIRSQQNYHTNQAAQIFRDDGLNQKASIIISQNDDKYSLNLPLPSQSLKKPESNVLTFRDPVTRSSQLKKHHDKNLWSDFGRSEYYQKQPVSGVDGQKSPSSYVHAANNNIASFKSNTNSQADKKYPYNQPLPPYKPFSFPTTYMETHSNYQNKRNNDNKKVDVGQKMSRFDSQFFKNVENDISGILTTINSKLNKCSSQKEPVFSQSQEYGNNVEDPKYQREKKFERPATQNSGNVPTYTPYHHPSGNYQGNSNQANQANQKSQKIIERGRQLAQYIPNPHYIAPPSYQKPTHKPPQPQPPQQQQPQYKAANTQKQTFAFNSVPSPHPSKRGTFSDTPPANPSKSPQNSFNFMIPARQENTARYPIPQNANITAQRGGGCLAPPSFDFNFNRRNPGLLRAGGMAGF